MKILITGVAGFIGSNLADYLLRHDDFRRQGVKIGGIDNLAYGVREHVPEEVEFHQADIRSPEIHRLFSGADFVFHLAAKNCLNDCHNNPLETADINVTGTVNVFEACRRAGVKKIIYAETSALYEGIKDFPTPEEVVCPEGFYAVSKLAGMHFARAYERFYRMNVTALRYFNVYGPRQDYRRTIPPVMSAFIIRLLSGERPVIYGRGNKKRDFIYVDDINDFHARCLWDRRTDGGVFNLGSAASFSILDIYQMVSHLLGVDISPEFKDELPGEADETLADIRKALALGWRPKTDLKSGLNRMVEYIRAEMDRGRILIPSAKRNS